MQNNPADYKSPDPLDRGETGIRYIAEDLLVELKGMEQHYPLLTSSKEYCRIKEAIKQIGLSEFNSTSIETLGKIYNNLKICLNQIRGETEKVQALRPTTTSKPIKFGEYLPATFEEFVARISHAKQEKDYYADGVEAAVHSIVLGEIPHGMKAVVPRFRDSVRGEVFLTLESCTDGDVVLEEPSGEKILNLLELSENQLVEQMDDKNTPVILAILSVRREIEEEYLIIPKPGLHKGPKILEEEARLAKTRAPQLFNLIKAVSKLEAENPARMRQNLARRVAMIEITPTEPTN